MSTDVQARDGWILVAIAWAQDSGGTLEAIVEAADTINHAIPLASEIEGCVNRAMARGLLTVANDRFVLSDAAKAALADTARSMKKLEQCEVATQYLQSLQATKAPAWQLDPSRLDAAIDAYQKRFHEKSLQR